MSDWPEGWERIICSGCGALLGGYDRNNMPTYLLAECDCGISIEITAYNGTLSWVREER